MQFKKFLPLFVISIVVAGILTFFLLRHQKSTRDLLLQQFAKPPEKQLPIVEFNHGFGIRSVAFSPVDASLFVSVGEDNAIKLWDRYKMDAPKATLTGHSNIISSIAFSPTGQLLVSGSIDGSLILWDVPSRKQTNTLKHPYAVMGVAISPDGQELGASGGNLGQIWDIRNPKEIKEIAALLHRNYEIVSAIDFSSDGKSIATGVTVFSPDWKLLTIKELDNLKIWDRQSKQQIMTLQGNPDGIQSVKFSPNSQFLASLGQEGGYIISNLSNQKPYGEVQTASANNLVFSPDGKMCASSYRGAVALWSVENGNSITLLGNIIKGLSSEIIGSPIQSVSFSQGGDMLISGDIDGILRLWNTTPQQLAKADATEYDKVRLVYFLPRDRKPRPDISEKLNKLIRKTQQVYAEQMETHGFGRKTFTFETDSQGKTKVYLIRGQHSDEYYHEDTDNKVREEIFERFDISKNVFLVAVDVSTEKIHDKNSGEIGGAAYINQFSYDSGFPKYTVLGGEIQQVHPLPYNDEDSLHAGAFPGGWAIMPASGSSFNWGIIAHELGHAFGLNHDFRENVSSDIMSYDIPRNQLSKCAAEWLNKSRFFNPNQSFFNKSATIAMYRVPAPVLNPSSFRFEITDGDGLYQAQLLVPTTSKDPTSGFKLHGCKLLNGEKRSTVEFKLTDTSVTKVQLWIIDVHGNIAWREFDIRK